MFKYLNIKHPLKHLKDLKEHGGPTGFRNLSLKARAYNCDDFSNVLKISTIQTFKRIKSTCIQM